jgi:hypothetical protein
MARGTRNKKVEAIGNQATLEAVKALDTEQVVSEVNNLQVSLQTTLAGVGASITSKIQQIATIDSAIALKNSRLKELYDVEAEAVSLDDLKATREEWLKAYENEKDARDAEWSEEESERDEMRRRQEDEWKYAFETQKKRTSDEWQATLNETKRQEAIRQSMVQKNQEDREAILNARENEYAAAQTQIKDFDARIKSEVSKAEAILTNTLKRQHEHAIALLAKDSEGAKALCDARLASGTESLVAMQKQVADLKQQLLEARADAKEIATQALTSSSDRKVADALRSVVDNRDQPQSKK